MDWLNIFGLIMIAVIMIPSIIFAIRCKEGFENKWSNKFVEVAEQIGSVAIREITRKRPRKNR